MSGKSINSIIMVDNLTGSTRLVPRNPKAISGVMTKAPRYAARVPMRENVTFPFKKPVNYPAHRAGLPNFFKNNLLPLDGGGQRWG